MIAQNCEVITDELVKSITLFRPEYVIESLVTSASLDVRIRCSSFVNAVHFAGLNIPFNKHIELRKPIRCVYNKPQRAHIFSGSPGSSGTSVDRVTVIATYLQKCFLYYRDVAARICDVAISTLQLLPPQILTVKKGIWNGAQTTLLARLTHLRSTEAFTQLFAQVDKTDNLK